MGAWYSIAMMAKILYPDRKVVAVVWDGGLVMNLGDLETIVRLGLNLTIIVLNDGAYGMIKWKQQAMDFADYGLDFTNPNFVMLAQSFGAQGIYVEDKHDFSDIVKKSFESPGLTLIDLPFVYPSEIK